MKRNFKLVSIWLAVQIILVACGAAGQAQPAAEATPVLPTPVSETAAGAVTTQPGAPAPTAPATQPWELEPIARANLAQLGLLAKFGAGDYGNAIAVSMDGARLAVASSGGVLFYDAANGQRNGFWARPRVPESLAFSPDGRYLAEVHREPSGETYTVNVMAGQEIYKPVLTILDLAANAIVLTQPLSGRDCGEFAAWDLAYSPDGQTLAFRDDFSLLGFGRADHLCLISTQDGSLVRSIPIELPWQTTSAASFSPNGRSIRVAVAARDTTDPLTRVRTYEVASGNLLSEFDGLGVILQMVCSPDGRWLALADREGARLLSAADGSLLTTLRGHSREVMGVAFSPDGSRLALGSQDGSTSLWQVPEGTQVWKTTALRMRTPIFSIDAELAIQKVVFSPDGGRVYQLVQTFTLYVSNLVQAVRVTDGQEIFRVYGRNSFSPPVLAPDASRAAFGGYQDGRIQVWSVAGNELLFELLGHSAMVVALAYAPDGTQIASASLDGTARIWRAEDGQPIAVLAGHSGEVRAVQYAPDGSRLATLGTDATLRLWNPADGSLLKTLPTQTGDWLASSLFFAPDGRSVLAAYGCPYGGQCAGASNGAGDLRRIDLESGAITTLLPYSVFSLALSVDQQRYGLYGPQGYQTGRFDSGAERSYVSPMGTGALAGAALSPDGGLFFSGNVFGLHVWDTSSGEMLALLREPTSIEFGPMQVSADGRLLLISGWDGTAGLWGVRRDP